MALPALSQSQDNYLFVESTTFSLGTFKQYDTSNILFTLDYTDYLTTNELIASVGYSVTPVTTPPLAVSASTIIAIRNIAGKGVSFLLGGGVAGTNYLVTVTANTSLGQTKVDTFQLNVTPQSNACGGAYPIGWPSSSCGPCSGTGNDPVREGSIRLATSRINVPLTASLVATQRSGRHAVTIVNIGNTYCELCERPFSIGDGVPLGPNAVVTLDTQAAIYGISQLYIGMVSVMETY